jgi:hypothetical protein
VRKEQQQQQLIALASCCSTSKAHVGICGRSSSSISGSSNSKRLPAAARPAIYVWVCAEGAAAVAIYSIGQLLQRQQCTGKYVGKEEQQQQPQAFAAVAAALSLM